MTLAGVTGHQIKTIRKVKVTMLLRDKEIRHTAHVVKNDFSIDYAGILGMDFLQKHRIKSDQKNYLQIDGVTLKLHPYKKLTLTPRSKTIIQAVTDRNRIGIVKSEEMSPGMFIGSCLVAPEEYVCPISMLNTTGETVEIITPLVTIEKLLVTDRENVLTLRTACNKNASPILTRRESIRGQIRTEHLNQEEKKTIEQLCKDFCDIFHLDGDVLTHTAAVEHEINPRIDSAPVNVRQYRLPVKRKE
ncbi:hypothetical protein ALC57_03148 [Trachymyrmex cornetzi]|uniref:Uncharacterized protein n=1 Tax=Trachymyrmex cornetzi TaxID=471704 RepID=A0A151JM87_9HYME|nr:hypothetical protein ALC57_03148 [Trachymyrmex cornetzi]